MNYSNLTKLAYINNYTTHSIKTIRNHKRSKQSIMLYFQNYRARVMVVNATFNNI